MNRLQYLPTASGFYYQKQFGERLWQRYGYERTLRSQDETLAVAKYIVGNPVRAGLVENPEHYPFSGSETYSLAAILAAIGDFASGPAKAGPHVRENRSG